jgi:hypothetical protein
MDDPEDELKPRRSGCGLDLFGPAECRKLQEHHVHHNEQAMAGQLYTTGKLAEALGISAGKVKKLIDELKIKEDSVKGVCKYYSDAALKKLKSAAK